MLTERTRTRLDKQRPMTTITLRIPVDVVASMKEIAPHKGFSGYQTLLKTYISEGLRRDEALMTVSDTRSLIAGLRQQGVPEEVIKKAQHAAMATA